MRSYRLLFPIEGMGFCPFGKACHASIISGEPSQRRYDATPFLVELRKLSEQVKALATT